MYIVISKKINRIHKLSCLVYNYTIMRIGIFGGTFDPVHFGHIRVARAAVEELNLDTLYMVVASDPPHKSNRNRLSVDIRYQMLQLALRDEERVHASDIEIKRVGKSYTVDTLEEFSKRFRGSELFFIVGGDMLNDFPRWRAPEEILKMATLVGVTRPDTVSDMRLLADKIENLFGGTVILTQFSGPNISSTMIRDRVYNAKPINTLVPKEIELFIYEKALYMPDRIRRIRNSLCGRLGRKRLKHTMLTAREAVLLADIHGVDAEQARLAAVLHDCIKLPTRDLLAYARDHCYDLTDEEVANPYLIHARLGAVVAIDEYGVTDKEVLKAIESHTLGRVGMSDLDKVTYIADKIEPSRDYPDVMRRIRECAYLDLNLGMIEVMRHSMDYTIQFGREVNPTTRIAMDSIIAKMKNNNGSKENNNGQ